MATLQEVFQCDHPAALVTGSGAPRVGREIAMQLAQRGCRVALHANNSLAEAEKAAEMIHNECGTQVIVTAGSLENPSVPGQLVDDTHREFGRIDIMINSAAIWQPTKLESVTAEEIRRYFEINALATFLCARAAGLKMVDQPAGGSIVNIGDWATVRPYLDHAAYFPSKGAVETLTRSLAVELGHRNPGIRVNCIQPGPVMLADDVSAEDAKQIAATTLVGRIGKPQHVAQAAVFLCENDFMTGTCIPVDGGRSIYAPDGLQVGLNCG